MRTTIAILILGVTACRGSSKPAPATIDASGPRKPPADATAATPTPADAAANAWSFDSDATGAAPKGFSTGLTGKGAPGRWEVTKVDDAPSPPNVLAQLDADDTDFRFPVAVADTPPMGDVRAAVRCKAISGKVDQACGLVFRYRDADNYYITRSNVLEGNIRLYYVKAGQRKQIASYKGTVTEDWHEYAVEVRGDHIQVFWDGQRVLDHHDGTFPDAGLVGVWTKADSVIYFDDLTVEPLDGPKAAP